MNPEQKARGEIDRRLAACGSRGDSGLADRLTQIWKISKLLANIAPRHLQE